ncbi:MAG: TMEM165/GDT1 family protein [Bdellovibrionales bacterium]|nr:TMEM165/GDT1 family protein [Bdellovibrionales bacterium]
MDWQVFFTTFSMIFIAEMGDKTQFAALAASANSKATGSILLAVVLALSTAGILGVIAGKYIGVFIGPQAIKWISGSIFIGVGIWVLISK